MKTHLFSCFVLSLLLVVSPGCKKENEGGSVSGGGAPAVSGTPAGGGAEAKAATAAASTTPSTHAGDEAGAKALLAEFLKPGADYVALSKRLQPTPADYSAVFATAELAQKAAQEYQKLWGMIEKMPIKPNAGQTELKIWSATTDDLKAGKGNAREFPGGYQRAVEHLKPGLTVYRWKFVKPGETLGMAFDGLYHLGGRWVLMPKPWRITR